MRSDDLFKCPWCDVVIFNSGVANAYDLAEADLDDITEGDVGLHVECNRWWRMSSAGDIERHMPSVREAAYVDVASFAAGQSITENQERFKRFNHQAPKTRKAE